MQPLPSRIILGALTISALVAAALSHQAVFVVLGLVGGGLLGLDISGTRRPLPRALASFRGRPVEVRVWGAPVPVPGGAELTLESVNVFGAGIHVFLQAAGIGAMHLKVAQPIGGSVGSGEIVIGSARYIQWEGKRMRSVEGIHRVGPRREVGL